MLYSQRHKQFSYNFDKIPWKKMLLCPNCIWSMSIIVLPRRSSCSLLCLLVACADAACWSRWKWFPKWSKKSVDFKSKVAFHKPISSYKQTCVTNESIDSHYVWHMMCLPLFKPLGYGMYYFTAVIWRFFKRFLWSGN